MIFATIITSRIQIRLRRYGWPVARPTIGLRAPGSGTARLLPASFAAATVVAAAAFILSIIGGVA